MAKPLPAVAPFPLRREAVASADRIFSEDRRLRLLQWLSKVPAYTANQAVLLDLLVLVGHVVSHDKLRADLAWLAEQGLIDLQDGSLYVARLIDRGHDAARGNAVIPGVRRPDPDV